MITLVAASSTDGGLTVVDFLTSAGVGALLCGVLVALINGVFSRGGKRADAAKALIEANKEFTSSVTGQYDRLLLELVAMKKVVIALTDTIDEILPELNGLPEEMRQRLREANTAAKLIS